jgi:hypothetical protein
MLGVCYQESKLAFPHTLATYVTNTIQLASLIDKTFDIDNSVTQ